MFAARAARSVPQAQKLAQQVRNNSVLSGPPTVKISPMEKFAHGIIMTVAFMAVPSWVLVNIKHYRAGK